MGDITKSWNVKFPDLGMYVRKSGITLADPGGAPLNGTQFFRFRIHFRTGACVFDVVTI